MHACLSLRRVQITSSRIPAAFSFFCLVVRRYVHTGLDAEATEGATVDTYNGAGVISLDLIDEAKI